MPKVFFNEVSFEWISLIAHSLMGFKEQDYFAQIHLKNAAIVMCIESSEADIKILEKFPLYGIKNYTTYISKERLPFAEMDGFLRIATLYFTEAFGQVIEPLPETLFLEVKHLLQARHPAWNEEKIETLIQNMDASFLRKNALDAQILALEMFERAQSRDRCQYEVQYEENWEEKNLPSMSMVLAWKNVPKHNFLYRLARLVHRHGLVMRRLNAAYIDPYKVSSIFMLSFGLHGSQGNAAWDVADISDFLQEVVTLKYFGASDRIDEVLIQPNLLRGNLGNFLRAAMNFIHQVLVHADPNLYTLENIEEALCRHPELTIKLCEAFEAKFHPQKIDAQKFETISTELKTLVNQLDTGHEILDMRRKNVLLQGMNFIQHILKTNFYRNNKTAFAFRLDPFYLDHAPFDRKTLFPELPFGIFFIKGMHFIGFHIRFRDLSRGGLRTVYPKRKERMLAEWNTVFTECYNLAYTQHKKNKDIPEGGAKGVIFLKPYQRLASESEILMREFKAAGLSEKEIEKYTIQFIEDQELEYLYQTQRSFIKSLLSLINCHDDGTLKASRIVDYWKRPEYIYLGPDENLHDGMIEWIANASKKESYRPGGAFISGKPKIGINHKEYGVTSLGVNICMEQLLYDIGIDPKTDTFTIKMTGGPDGDVAGNQILNLYRDYPQTAKLIALTDVSGTIYDPAGLDLEVCVNLFKKSQPISYYPPSKLNIGGFLLDREKRREPTAYVQQTLCWRNEENEAIATWISGNEMNALFRNNVHQVKADLFIPCGGRPRTLKESNYKDFLDQTGQPTAKGIIEGANLYLSPIARYQLEQAGVLIIKDSSANKGGVICSSFEILCSLCLTDAEFLEHKEALVTDILKKVRKCSLNEAQLLLSEHKQKRMSLCDLSDEISKRINYFNEQLLDYLEGIQLSKNPKDPFIACFLHYCPKLLFEKFPERLHSHIPDHHKKAIIASHIASHLVYQRGLDWFPTLIDILPILLQDHSLLFDH